MESDRRHPELTYGLYMSPHRERGRTDRQRRDRDRDRETETERDRERQRQRDRDRESMTAAQSPPQCSLNRMLGCQ